MAVAYYRDPVTKEWVPLGGPTGPSGAAGPPGAPGPTGVSGDPNNTATIGSDGLPFVPGINTTAMDTDYVNLTGDTMTGELLLPDPTVTPPTVPAEVAARGYVDQVTTVSDVDPDPVTNAPARDNLVWFTVGDAPLLNGGTDWVGRPPDWLPNVDIAPRDQKIGILVQPSTSGAVSVEFIAATGGSPYTVNWGDGSAMETFASYATASHSYAVGTTQMWCIVEPTAGDTLSLFKGTPGAGTGALELLIGPDLSGFDMGVSFSAIQHVDFLGTCVDTGPAMMFFNYPQLVAVTGQLNTSGAPQFSNMFGSCPALITVPLFDTSSANTLATMFAGSSSLVTVPLYDTSSVTNCNSIFNGCSSLTTVPPMDMSMGTDFGGIFQSCSALTSVEAYGFRYHVSVQNSSMDASALNAFFTNLGTADNTAQQQQVNITGTPGAATCDRTIATAKGWLVVG